MPNKNEPKESMVFYKSFLDAINFLEGDENKLEFCLAILNYGIYGTKPNFSNSSVLAVFSVAKPSIDMCDKRYLTSIENGKKGGAPKGNQNARKNHNPITLPQNEQATTTLKMETNCLSEKQPKKQPNFNLTVTDTVTDAYTDTGTYTETYTETDYETYTETETLNEANGQNISNNFFSHHINNINSSYIPIGVQPEKFFSLTNKFKQYFPNKNNELKKLTELNELNYDNINIEQLIAKIDLSDFLRSNNNLGLEWCLLNKDKILCGYYDNFASKQSQQSGLSDYLKQNFKTVDGLNCIFDNIEEMSKELDKYKDKI